MAVTTPRQASSESAPSRLGRFYHSYGFRAFWQAVVTIGAVVTFTFFLVRLMPGSPVDVYIDFLVNMENLSHQEARNRAAAHFAFDLDASYLEQYLTYVGNLLRGDLGFSITSTGTRVIDLILRFLPWTLFSVGLGLLISFTLGMVLGMVAAYYRNSPLDISLSFSASALSAVPNYIWGLLIILVFGVQLQWFSIGDLRGTHNPALTPGFYPEFIASIFKHAALPVLVYVLGTLGSWILTMRSSTTSVLGEDYVTIARARGLPPGRIITAYVGRNASLPLFTLLAISIGFVIGGSIIIEELFLYRGLGSLLFWAITMRDFTVMQGVFLVITLSVVLSNILADLLYSRLDPRVRISGEK